MNEAELRRQAAEIVTLRNVGVTLQTENEALRKDAERYRWIRKRSSPPQTQAFAPPFRRGEEYDAAIDAAMAARPGGEKE